MALLVCALFCVASCGGGRGPGPAAPRPAPPRVLAVTSGHLTLEANAHLELHTWLAAAARSDDPVPRELETAKHAYARSLQDDDEDALLARTARRLTACEDQACATSSLAAEGFGYAYARAAPLFYSDTRFWLDRATVAWAGVEASHAVLGPASEALLQRVASELAIALPEHPLRVAVVSTAPPVGRHALIPVALSTRGRCFIREPRAGVENMHRVQEARLLDCIFVQAILGSGVESPLRDAIVRELGEHDGQRAWSLLVVHAVAAVVTGWEAHHLSVYRRSALAVEARSLEWLAKEWRGARIEPVETFAVRFAALWRALHTPSE